MLLDAFMKLEEPKVDGESTDSLHDKQIEILSLEQSICQPSASGGPETKSKQREYSPLRVIKLLDRSSPKLMEAAASGKLFQKVTINLCQPSGTTATSSTSWKRIIYLEIILEQVHVAGVRLMGDPRLHATTIGVGEVLAMGPMEELDLSFRKIKWLYKGGTGNANISGSWNLATNSVS